MSNNNNEMKKELRAWAAAMATVVGCVIGSGVFFKPTAIYTATGGAPVCNHRMGGNLSGLPVCGNDICRNRNLDSRNRRYARISEKGIR